MDAGLLQQAKELAAQMAGEVRTIEDINDVIRLMSKSIIERALDAEMDVHLGRVPGAGAPSVAELPPLPAPSSQDGPGASAESSQGEIKVRNRRNGRSRKNVRSELGEFPIETPRDRDGTFEPMLVPKHQRRLAGFDEKILALYAKGMSTRDIQEILQQLYGVEVSPTLVSEVTAAIDEEALAWRTRPLEPVWPIVYFDATWCMSAAPTAA
jgi:putative transposase